MPNSSVGKGYKKKKKEAIKGSEQTCYTVFFWFALNFSFSSFLPDIYPAFIIRHTLTDILFDHSILELLLASSELLPRHFSLFTLMNKCM